MAFFLVKHDEKKLFLVYALILRTFQEKYLSVMIVKDNLKTLLPIRCGRRLTGKQIEVNDIEEVLFSFRSKWFLKAQIQFSFS